MTNLRTHYHPAAKNLEGKTLFKRLATRAIVLREHEILLLHTDRYQDYSLPGGGLDDGEDPIAGMKRELEEETGARNVRNVEPFGIYEEYRPWYKPEFDLVHMTSYCYSCSIDEELSETRYEPYEVSNGMKPVWIDIHKAIAHNQNTLKNSEKKGLSLEREIFLLMRVVQQLLVS